MNEQILQNLIALGLIYPGNYTITGETAQITEKQIVDGAETDVVIVEYQFPNFAGINRFKKILPDARVIALPFNGVELDVMPSDYIAPAELSERDVLDIMNALIKSGSIAQNEYRIAGQKATIDEKEFYTGRDLMLLDPVNGNPVYHIGPLALGENYFYDYFMQKFTNTNKDFAELITYNGKVPVQQATVNVGSLLIAIVLGVVVTVIAGWLLNKVVK
jgi:hypothetical protein